MEKIATAKPVTAVKSKVGKIAVPPVNNKKMSVLPVNAINVLAEILVNVLLAVELDVNVPLLIIS